MDADAYDEGSNARHGPDGPGGPLREGPVPAGAVPDDASLTAAAPEPAGSAAGTPETEGRGSAASGAPEPPDTEAPEPPAPDTEAREPAGPEAPVPAGPESMAPDDGGTAPVPADSGARVPFPPVLPAARPLSTSEALPGHPAAAAAPAPAPAPALTGIAALPLRHQIVAAFALAAVGVLACVHLGMVFLHVAPSNTVTKQHGRAIDEWIYPEFEQNWKLFAPNPLQQNIDVQVRARVRTTDGGATETGWYDLSALDGAAIDGNLLPSHTQQNELRRAWDFYVGTHDNDNRPVGLRGDLSERYLRRVVVLRLHREGAADKGAVVERVQVRSRTTNVRPPEWSDEQVPDKPVLRELPWWTVPEKDLTDTRTTEASAR
ncbi:DUF5819 family protein [Streptomyces sp. NPDC059466]|uniref:DUF5819 family protein n=1 Tax=unclassified Streptomyces TaxID=2593676 RepID=UPI0036CFB37E